MFNLSIKSLMGQLRAKALIEGAFGQDAYRLLRAKGLKAERSAQRLRNRFVQRIANREFRVVAGDAVIRDGVAWTLVADMTLAQAIKANFQLVSESLNDASIPWWLVDFTPTGPTVLGVDVRHRQLVLESLAAIGPKRSVYVTGFDDGILLRHVSTGLEMPELANARILGVVEPQIIEGSELAYGMNTACQIEFWEISDGVSAEAPRENRASRLLGMKDFHLVPSTVMATPTLVPSVLTKKMLDDVSFPVDAVYTWVDGEDPVWTESKHRTESEIAGVKYHGEANHAARFRSRDELKYSLRSLEMYAPWFRKIYIVTAGQVPEWLNTDNPKIQLVDHKDIYPDTSYLPTFNSNSIISRLHHIEGLSEHYVYINDDVFFGRPLTKDRFFLPSGIAKVSPSKNRRPFGTPSELDEPHLNLTRNMRTLLEDHFGVTISRAIKHTPHPQLRSVHFEMETAFKGSYERTWASRFRHHTDIVADQLHHYYAQIVGKAVPTNLRYNYINILDDKYKATMDTTLRLRHRDTFCINDAPVEGATPIADEDVTAFLEAYFPVKSSFEK